MNVNEEQVRKIANVRADFVMDDIEWELGVNLTDQQWEDISQAIENDLAASITEQLAAL